jgi:hypothetical protein
MNNKDFAGWWTGQRVSAQFSKVTLRIKEKNGQLTAYGYARTTQSEVEILELEGSINTDNKVHFDLINYVTDNPNTTPPIKAKITAALQESPTRELEITFVTAIGTHGSFSLRPSRFIHKIPFIIPLAIHVIYRHIKSYLRLKLRYLYMLFVISMAVFSIFATTGNKISVIEAILLALPIPFLFTDKIKDLVLSLSLRKIGPLEFQSQSNTGSAIHPTQIINDLSKEFGQDVVLFSYLNQFFVSRTKSVLRWMVANNQPISQLEFIHIAKGLGVAEKDMQATMDALRNSGCVKMDNNGRLYVDDKGKSYLLFESKITLMSQGN